MNSLDAYTLIISGSIVIVLSFLFGGIAKKTNIPSVLLLIVLGVIIQYLLPIFGVNNPKLNSELEVLGIIGLIMIVLEAALELKLERQKLVLILKSFFAGLIGLVVTAFAIASIFYYLMDDISKLQALLYAVPISILSSAIIIPSVGNLNQEKKEFHIYESTFSDILGIMMFYFILSFLNHTSLISDVKSSHPVSEFFTGLGITLAISLVSSYVLVYVFQNVKAGAKLFLLIAILLILYSVGKKLHLSPLIIILVFGLAVSNSSLFFIGPLKKLIKQDAFKELQHGLHIVTLESAFVVRTFFFVIFGMSILLTDLLSFSVWYTSIIILTAIYLLRFLILKIFIGKDIIPQLYIAPRGLITVLLFYAIPKEFAIPNFEPGILLFIIIATGIIMTAGMIYDKKRAEKPIESNDEEFEAFQSSPMPDIDQEANNE
ncbi:MAG: hypothetical protein Kow0079_12540 [Vicingaceae bacterium]